MLRTQMKIVFRGIEAEIFTKILIPIVLLLCFTGLTRAQQVSNHYVTDSYTPSSIAPGSPIGSYSLTDIESVNLASGSLGVSVPLLNIGGRGNAGYTISVPVQSQRWQIREAYYPSGTTGGAPTGWAYHYHPDSGGASDGVGFGPGLMRSRIGSRFQGVCGFPAEPPGGGEIQTRLTFTGSNGTETDFYDQQTGGAAANFSYPDPCTVNPANRNKGRIWLAADGSGLTFITDGDVIEYPPIYGGTPDGRVSGFLLFPDGTRYRFDLGVVSYITDRNGNKTNFTYNAGQNILSVTDPLNRVVTITPPSSGGQPTTVSFKGFGGAARTIEIGSDSLSNLLRADQTLKTDRQLFPELGNDAGNTTPTDVQHLISYIRLPDGREYHFKYDSYSNVARIELPTGGAYEYDWSGTATTGCPAVIRRWVTERRVYPNGSSGSDYETKTVYEGLGAKVTQFARVSGADVPIAVSKHLFNPVSNGNCDGIGYWNIGLEGRELQTETYTADGNTLLKKVVNEYQSGQAVGQPYTKAVGYRLIRTTTTLADVSPNLISKTEYTFDPNVSFDRPTDTLEYDFGEGQPGALRRRTHIDYLNTNPNQGNANYLDNSIHIKTLPIQTWVSSDANGNTKVSFTKFEYDNYAPDSNHAGLLSRSSVSGFDSANYGTSNTIRGNLTGITFFGNAANQTLPITAFSQFDILGNVVNSIDARGHASITGYNDNFGSPDGEAITNSAPSQLNGLNTFAFPTSTTNLLNWTTYTQYDYQIAAPINTQNINGVISKIVYTDPLDRPTQHVTAVGIAGETQTTTVYDDTNHRIQTTSDLNSLNDNLLKSENYYDKLGRTVETRKYEASGGYISIQAVPSLTVQDPVTNQWRSGGKTSNPFRPGAGETAVWTTSLSDELGRPIKVITPDGAISRTDYSGNALTVTDQAGKVRRSIRNALGQLTRIDEPTSSGLGTIASPNQPTAYTFDVLNNLLSVTQNGTGTEQCGPAAGSGGSCAQTRTFAYNSLSRLTSATNPESGTINYTYDNNGNLATKIDARSITTTYTYDVLDRVTQRAYTNEPSGSETPDVSYSYDNVTNAKGKLTKVTTGTGTIADSISEYQAFDILGRVTQSQQWVDGTAYGDPMTYTYNLAGALTEEKYPSGRVVKNVLNNDGSRSMLESKKNANSGFLTYARAFTYNAAGAVKAMQLGNGRWEGTTFNNRLQPTDIDLGIVQGGTSLLNLHYDYGTTGNNGNVQSQTITVPSVGINTGFTAIQTYTYDSLNRLKDATETESGTPIWKQTFVYDRYGNRAFDQANTTVPASFANPPVTNPTVNTANNRFASGQGYSYDLSGNTTADAARTFVYDAENKQIAVSDANGTVGQYGYDGDGKRIKKSVPSTGETTIFVYDASGNSIAEYSTTIAAPQDAKVNYLTADHLGSPRINTDQNGAVIARHDYHPFGEEIDGAGGRTTGLNYGDDTVRKKFTGYEKDEETNEDFAEARYLNSEHGRFNSPDPLMASARIESPQSFNRYSYVLNNPSNLTDPDGMQSVGPCPDGKICDENGKVIEKDDKGNLLVGLVGVVQSLPAGAVAGVSTVTVVKDTIITPSWWEMLLYHIKKTPGIVGRNAPKGFSFLGKAVGVVGVVLLSPTPTGCDFGPYNQDTGLCERDTTFPDFDTQANPDTETNSPTTTDQPRLMPRSRWTCEAAGHLTPYKDTPGNQEIVRALGMGPNRPTAVRNALDAVQSMGRPGYYVRHPHILGCWR